MSTKTKTMIIAISCVCLCVIVGVVLAVVLSRPTLQKIEIDDSTVTKRYYVGDTFKVDGLKVTAVYSKKSKEVADYSFKAQKDDNTLVVQKNGVFEEVGDYTVTISYKQKTATYTINVKLAPEVTMIDLEANRDYNSYIEVIVGAFVQAAQNHGDLLSEKDIYSINEFGEIMGNYEHIKAEIIPYHYYYKVATLANFDLYDEVTSLTFGNTVYGVNDEAVLLLGSHKAIKFKVWYVEDNELYVALPVFYTETSLSNQFKINNVVVTHNLTTATKHNLTDFTTDSTNSVVKDLNGTSNVTLLDETSPLTLKIDEESDSEIDIRDSYVYSKIELENGGSNTCTLYAIGKYGGEGFGIKNDYTFSLCMKDVKTGTDGACDDLDGTSWKCSIVARAVGEESKNYYSCKFAISTQAD